MRVSKMVCIALSILTVFSFTACSTGTGNNQSSSSENEKVEITLLDQYPVAGTDAVIAPFNKVLQDFKKRHPNITVKDEALSGDGSDYTTKIKTLAAGNEMPDVFNIEGSNVKTFADAKLINPVNDFLDADPTYKSKFLFDTFSDLTYNGKYYGIPIYTGATSIVFYNKKIFSECGIQSFPKDWDTFVAE